MAKKRILIAEDEPNVLKATKLRLEHEGYTVLSAVDGEDTLQQAESALPIHLILLDIKMPKLDGYEVCERLKRSPTTAHIPIIVFTASEVHFKRLADRCIELGALDWIKKPFETKELMVKVHRALDEETREG